MLSSAVHHASRAVVSTIVGVTLLAGCAAQTYPMGQAPSHPIAKARELQSAPAMVRTLPDPASCGEYELGQGGRLPRSAARCIRSANDGPASLVYTRPTTEGDPIVTFVLHRRGTRSVVLWTTTEFDAFGSPGWERVMCDAATLGRRGFCVG